jgi:hypothetical protein
MVSTRAPHGRSRANRVTHKSKLHLLVGDHDVQPIVLGEEDEKEAQGLSAHGVDAEDANVSRLPASIPDWLGLCRMVSAGADMVVRVAGAPFTGSIVSTEYQTATAA